MIAMYRENYHLVLILNRRSSSSTDSYFSATWKAPTRFGREILHHSPNKESWLRGVGGVVLVLKAKFPMVQSGKFDFVHHPHHRHR